MTAVTADVNEARITGTVVDAPKVTQTRTGHERATFKVATTKKYRSQGDTKYAIEHHFIVAWEDRVDLVRQLAPGNMVTVIGPLQTHSWNDYDTGVRQQRTEIIVERVVLHHLEP